MPSGKTKFQESSEQFQKLENEFLAENSKEIQSHRILQDIPGRDGRPSAAPSFRPSVAPSFQQTSSPTSQPSSQPSSEPSGQPTFQPSGSPTFQPSNLVTARPSNGIAASNLSSNRLLNNGEIAGIAASGGFLILMGLMCYLGSYITRKLTKAQVAVSTDDIEINVQRNGGGGRI